MGLGIGKGEGRTFFGVGGEGRAMVLLDDDSTGDDLAASFVEGELIWRRLKHVGRLPRLRFFLAFDFSESASESSRDERL
jgi:hypothetical protein